MEVSGKDSARSQWRASKAKRGTGHRNQQGSRAQRRVATDLEDNFDRYYEEEEDAPGLPGVPVRKSKGADLGRMLAEAEQDSLTYRPRGLLADDEEAQLPAFSPEAADALSIDLDGLEACLREVPLHQLLGIEAYLFQDESPELDAAASMSHGPGTPEGSSRLPAVGSKEQPQRTRPTAAMAKPVYPAPPASQSAFPAPPVSPAPPAAQSGGSSWVAPAPMPPAFRQTAPPPLSGPTEEGKQASRPTLPTPPLHLRSPAQPSSAPVSNAQPQSAPLTNSQPIRPPLTNPLAPAQHAGVRATALPQRPCPPNLPYGRPPPPVPPSRGRPGASAPAARGPLAPQGGAQRLAQADDEDSLEMLLESLVAGGTGGDGMSGNDPLTAARPSESRTTSAADNQASTPGVGGHKSSQFLVHPPGPGGSYSAATSGVQHRHSGLFPNSSLDHGNFQNAGGTTTLGSMQDSAGILQNPAVPPGFAKAGSVTAAAKSVAETHVGNSHGSPSVLAGDSGGQKPSGTKTAEEELLDWLDD